MIAIVIYMLCGRFNLHLFFSYVMVCYNSGLVEFRRFHVKSGKHNFLEFFQAKSHFAIIWIDYWLDSSGILRSLSHIAL